MGLPVPPRAARSAKRAAAGALLVSSLLLLSGCSADDVDQIQRLAMPEPATTQAPAIYDLWRYAWLAAIIVGVIVWGLIAWVVLRYRRRSADEVPVQTRYNLPLEIFYTVAPIMMVIVFFYWTVNVQNEVLDEVEDPDLVVEVVGQQWSWTFNHGVGEGDGPRTPDVGDGEYRYDDYVYESGTAAQIPTLVLPVDQTVQFNLHSPDVIHDFWVTGFLMKMDVIPGRVNHFQVTPDRIGTYAGKCAELCGTYHSRMLFNVEVVSQADYEAYLDQQAERGFTSDGPLLGGAEARTQEGLEDEGTSEGSSNSENLSGDDDGSDE
ncbi:cytochrome c oxidase subunit II [Nocardioides perillae]|uniref:cytochrome-c oxidase n=1 Tax=Nocardioides perillae TaxID=1119534 RepID=A0A7Y9RYK4_9ACTN|nr:cytochrome c oxidase subunit 2 [Nocardioides perillae]